MEGVEDFLFRFFVDLFCVFGVFLFSLFNCLLYRVF